MPNVVTQTALVQPTSGTSTGALVDYEMAKFRENNGTVSVGVDILTGDIVASLGTINSGTITRVEQGSINVTAGTVIVTNGTIGAGTQNTLGTVGVVNAIIAGTQNTLGTVGVVNAIAAGTQNTLGTVGVVSLLSAGTITALANGTIGAGTLNTLGTVANVNAGSITVVAGTVNAGTVDLLKAGTVTRVEGGSIVVTVGTFTGGGGSIIAYGAGGTGIAAVGNPQVIAGTDSGGTTYGLKVNTSGNAQVDVNTGTVTSVTNLAGGTVTKLEGGTLGILSQGSINVTAGTITAGTLTNLVSGTINSATISGNLGTLSMLSAGTITNVGSVVGVGILTAGTVSMINAGTITSVGSVVGLGGTAKVDMATLISGEDQTNNVLMTEQQFSYFHHVGTTGSVSGTVKASAGLLHNISFNTHTAGGTYALYDSAGTSATVIGIVDSAGVPNCKIQNVKFTTALTIVSGSVCDVTIAYR